MNKKHINDVLLSEIPVINLYATISEGLKDHEPPSPFMIKNASKEFLGVQTSDIILSILKKSECYIHGYNNVGQLIKTTSDAVYNKWQRGDQPINILDAPIEALGELVPSDYERLYYPEIK